VKLVKGEGRATRARARSPRRGRVVTVTLNIAVTGNCRLMRIMVTLNTTVTGNSRLMRIMVVRSV
jgi:hypothetical protein